MTIASTIIILTLVVFAVAAVAVAVFAVLSAEQAPKHISNDWKNGPQKFQSLETQRGVFPAVGNGGATGKFQRNSKENKS